MVLEGGRKWMSTGHHSNIPSLHTNCCLNRYDHGITSLNRNLLVTSIKVLEGAKEWMSIGHHSNIPSLPTDCCLNQYDHDITPLNQSLLVTSIIMPTGVSSWPRIIPIDHLCRVFCIQAFCSNDIRYHAHQKFCSVSQMIEYPFISVGWNHHIFVFCLITYLGGNSCRKCSH